MQRSKDGSRPRVRDESAGPRATLRVPEVLMALAGKRGGSSLAELSSELDMPKTSLYRLLRTLARAGYLSHEAGSYRLGPTAFQLARLIASAVPSTGFPSCARPVIEWLAQQSHETVMLGILSGCKTEIVYVDVIDSTTRTSRRPRTTRFAWPCKRRCVRVWTS